MTDFTAKMWRFTLRIPHTTALEQGRSVTTAFPVDRGGVGRTAAFPVGRGGAGRTAAFPVGGGGAGRTAAFPVGRGGAHRRVVSGALILAVADGAQCLPGS